MIKSKSELNEYLKRDMSFYHEYKKRDQLICSLTKDPAAEIVKYLKYLRREEYYYNCGKNHLTTILYLLNLRKKNSLGIKLGIKIPKNTFGPGLTIFHHGEVIVNEKARIGSDAILHGGNCIGNNGKTDSVPTIGDHLNLGVGAKVIGKVGLGNHITIGANAVVVESFLENNITLVGIPARQVRNQEDGN